jgi:hypothetical protein
MPVSMISEQTGYIGCFAYANVADKGSAMAGDGTLATPYDCVQEALEALTVFSPGDISVVRNSVGTAKRLRTPLVTTITTATPHGFSVGDYVSIRGMGGSSYNGEQIEVGAVTADTFTYPGGTTESETVDTGGTVALYRRYDVTFQGAFEEMNIPSFLPDNALTGGVSPDILVSEITRGKTGDNEVQRIRLNGLPTGGAFRLTYVIDLTGNSLEVSQAMHWIQGVLASDTVITSIISPSQQYLHAIPLSEKGTGKHYLVIKPIDTRDSRWLGKAKRSKAENYLEVKIVIAEKQPSKLTELLAQRLSDIFEHQLNQTLSDGLVLSCVRRNQVVALEVDSGQHWINLGVLLQVNIKQT